MILNQPLSPEREKAIRKENSKYPSPYVPELLQEIDHLRAQNIKLVQLAGNFEPGSEEETESFIQRIEQAVEKSKNDAEELKRLRALPCQPPGTPEGMQVVRITHKKDFDEWGFDWEAELAPLPQKGKE